MGLYDNIRSKTEDTQTSGPRTHQRGDLAPIPEMIGGPAADIHSAPFRGEETTTSFDNPRALPAVPPELAEAMEENELPDHGPARGAAILRKAVIQMLANAHKEGI